MKTRGLALLLIALVFAASASTAQASNATVIRSFISGSNAMDRFAKVKTSDANVMLQAIATARVAVVSARANLQADSAARPGFKRGRSLSIQAFTAALKALTISAQIQNLTLQYAATGDSTYVDQSVALKQPLYNAYLDFASLRNAAIVAFRS